MGYEFFGQQQTAALYYAGQSATVVLIHGLGSSRYDWESIKPKLVDVDFHVFAVDLPGHGDSVKPGLPEFGIRVLEVLRQPTDLLPQYVA